MSAKGNLERFVEKAPLAVMTRCIVGEVINERFEEVFETSRGRNYDRNIPFSVLAKAVGEIVLGLESNRNQAYKKHKDELKSY